jgi:dipeptidyl aminopeptidase/acylaminoacyl peptidase
MRRLILVLIPLGFLCLPPAVALAQHPFDVRDLIAMDRVSSPAVSPDGRSVVFVVSALDLEANRRRTDLWIVDTAGGEPRQLTSHPASDVSPVWSPDGQSVFFLSSRSGSMQVWRQPVGGGEPAAVTALPLDVGSFVLSRDGSLVAVSLEVFPDCDTLACTTGRLDARAKAKASGQIFDRLFIRHWDTWSDGRRSHLFVVPVAGGAPVDVMKGMDADSPSKPFGGSEEYTFTPDGRSLVFSARDAGRAEAWSTNFDLYVAPVDGASKPHDLTEANKAWDTGPVFSPDGKTLAYRAMSRAGYESDKFHLVLLAWPDGPEHLVATSWDRSPNEIVFSPDGGTIYATAANLGQTSLFAIDVGSDAVRTVVKDGHVTSPAPAGDRLVVAVDTLTGPAELQTVKPDGSDLRPLTHVNAARLADVKLGEPEQFTFKGWNDETVYAWVVKPIDFDPSRKYPIAFLIHGGPQGSFSNNFHYRWNAQNYAAAGYAVIMVDFHGSTGYGQAFTDSIGGDWGGKPLVDLQKGFTAAVTRYPWMDAGNACALGASFGGFMINWIEGNWPDRFKCLVNHDGNLDERFAYYATEELWFPEWDHRGMPWTNPEGYAKHNPVEHVARWKTPMLVVHGGRDYRIPDAQGMSTFTALQRRGIPSRFMYFPDENHWVLKPANSILWHDTVLAWLAQWTKKN